MRIVIGSLQCEGNSLSPVPTRLEDFDYAKGDEMLQKLKISDFLEGKDIEIVPTIYAHALPGGAIVEKDFLHLAHELVDAIPTENIDGIWLYLHGTMYVENIGSGDTYLVKLVREKVGYDVPLSLAMDFHADNTDEIVKMANTINAFRTAPHTDHKETQIKGLKLLIDCIERKLLPSPQIARANVVIPGDAVQTSLEPLKSIMEYAEEIEKTVPGIMSAQVFNGQPWIDEPYMGPNFVVTHESDVNIAKEYAEKLARKFYDARYDFKFLVETAEPEKAIEIALADPDRQVFISDSGDNTTAGASGDNAYMLNRVIKSGAENVLIAGIADSAACDECYKKEIGDEVTVKVGGSLDKNSESAVITGKIIHKGDILSYTGGNEGPSVTLDCGKFTVVITKNRASMCRPDIFESVDLDFRPFKIVVVKLGYLFPELAKVAERAILAFTPGSSTERLEDMHMKNIRRPMFPLDDNFM